MSTEARICESCKGRHFPLHLDTAGLILSNKRGDACSRCKRDDATICAGNGYRLCSLCYETALNQEPVVVAKEEINRLRTALRRVDEMARDAVWNHKDAPSDNHAAALTLPEIRALITETLTA
jgi:hypothetical protein